VRLLAPIIPKRNVFCVGWNYTEHFVETKGFQLTPAPQEIPDHPALFTKNPFAIIGPEAAIRHPAPISEQLDYEIELAVVIGFEGRDIAERDALDHVFGYTIANDVSVRDVQRTRHGGQWFKGKNFDTHLPLGPWIVTKDEIPDPQTLRLTTRVNGATKQDSNTKHMVFPVARIISEISAGLTLYPGDVIITGTPEGVGVGRKPPEWLKPGDVVELEIERIGILRNHIERGA
jgi:2-keto-4-pentenoate hydratase/2-oxohepta-3-ene-1,7-dioic acid hydratase in catechol pathway